MSWRLRTLLLVLAVGFVALNGLAWMHVRAMTHFTVGGVRSAKPEAMGWGEKARVLLFGVSLPRPSNDATPEWEHATHRVPVGDEHVEVWDVPLPDSLGVVVLFHGYGGAKASLLPVAERLRAQGWSTVLVDFRGSGGSDGDTVTLGYREARDVAAVLDWSQARDPDRPHVLYGFSMGGAAVLKALSDGATPDAAIVESAYDSLRTTVGHRFHSMGLPATPGADLLLVWGSIDLGTNAFAMRPADWARTIEVPLVVISGSDDPRVWPEEARAVADAAGAPFTLLDGVGHELGAVASPSVWDAAIGPLLATVGGEGP